MRTNLRRQSYAIAFCALMTALGTALMTAGGWIPIATYCSPLLAGVLLLPVLEEFGRREAWMVWAATMALSLMLSVDKEAAAMYLFVGYYPILKPSFDRLRPWLVSLGAKLALFTLALAAMYALLLYVFQLDVVLEDMESLGFWANVLLDGMLVVIMLLYDFVLGRLRLLYVCRLRPRLKNLPGQGRS